MIIRIIFLSLFGILLSGCFGSFGAVPHIRPKAGSDVALHHKIRAKVGDVILNAYKYTQTRGIKILEDVDSRFILGKIHLKKGDFLKEYIDNDTQERYFCGKNYQPFGKSKADKELCLVDNLDDDIDSFVILFKRKGEKPYYLGPFSLVQKIYRLRRGRYTDIRYKSAKIRIYKATRDRIIYKVLEPLRFDDIDN
ncbi:hypothetical protein MNB_SM-3-1175 [hydrothermal vent metagenome]|uniref:Lipoprotein n=1 Tax=hydrothermal vent metagenome TaxID=652676 RepID=A0A1W1D571_9ZZZZ